MEKTKEFIDKLPIEKKLECLPENMTLEKDSGRWAFFNSPYTQECGETLDEFLGRVLYDISQGGMGEIEQEVANINLAVID